jgi:Tol biopolymer transport system component
VETLLNRATYPLIAVGLLINCSACGLTDRPILFTSLAPGTTESVYELRLDSDRPRRLIAGDSAVAINLAVRSPDGRSLAFAREFGDSTHIVLSDVHGGNRRRVSTPPGSTFTFPEWSQDGRSLLVSGGASVGQLGVFIVSESGARLLPVLVDSGLYRCPSWSADGSRLVVSHYLHGQSALLEVTLPGRSKRILVRSDSTQLDCPRWSAGDEIAFTVYHGSGRAMWERFPSTEITSSVWVLRVKDGSQRRVSPVSNITNYPSWSRDGQWLVFQSDHHAAPIRDPTGWDTRLDSLEIYIVRRDGTHLRRLTHNGHFDAHPSW